MLFVRCSVFLSKSREEELEMRIPQRLDYAMRTLVHLASKPQGTFSSAGELATHLGLPKRFVEQQITVLARASIMKCRRGPTGGCALARSPAEISALDIVTALEGCAVDIPRQQGSAVAQLWSGLNENVEEYLASISLKEIADDQQELDMSVESIYYI